MHDAAGRGGPGRLLDVACGSGRHAREFAALGWEVTGVDYSPDLLERARANAPGHRRSIEQDMRELDVPGERFDADHLPVRLDRLPAGQRGVVAALAGMRRHLAPQGALAVEFLHAPALLRARRPGRACAASSCRTAASCCACRETRLDEAARGHGGELRARRACAPTARYERWRERQSNRFFARRGDARADGSSPACGWSGFVPAYREGGPIDADTFHVIARARSAA